MNDISRRRFLTLAGGAAAAYMVGVPRISSAATPFVLPPLPYEDVALAPVISQETVGFHYGKHQQTYINNLNTLVATPDFADYADLSLTEIIRLSAHRSSQVSVFNNAAQAWNHQFYWESLTPNGGDAQKPTGQLLALIEASFGSYETFKTQFRDAAVGQFGSGWAWLVLKGDRLSIVTTANADNPFVPVKKGGKHHHGPHRHSHRSIPVPLLTIDVWEHAYYIDYRNRRKDHVSAVIDNLLNWNKAAERLGA